jgi:hypothetical protein
MRTARLHTLDMHDINIRVHLLAYAGYLLEAKLMQRMSDVIQQQDHIIAALLAPASTQEKVHGPDTAV